MRFLIGRYFILMVLCFAFQNGDCQKFLQLEKANSLKTMRFYVGDQIIYQIKSDPGYWYAETIKDVLVQDSLILLEVGYVHIGEISFIKTDKSRKWSKKMGNALIQFGGQWGFWSVMGAAFGGGTLGWAALTVPLISSGVGFIIKLIFKTKKHKIGNNKRLRLMDISLPSRLDEKV